MIPSRVTIYAALTECENIWSRFRVHNLKFPRLPQSINKDEAVDLSELTEVAHFDLTSLEEGGSVDTELTLKAIQKGEVHGLVGLFDAVVYDDIQLIPEDGWKELFIPFENSLQVSEGDEVVVNLKFTPGELNTLFVEPT
jgi:hypothetical protein